MKLKRNITALVALLIASLINIYAVKHIKKNQPDDKRNFISVDCSNPKNNTKSMVGFLLSVNLQNPPSKLISDLNPQYWRINSRNKNVLNRIQSFGAKPIFLVSDNFRYPGSHAGFYRAAHLAPQDWDDTVKHMLTVHQSENFAPVYDLWNEPNAPFFWSGSQNQFFNTFKVAYDRIRATSGNDALISGPSINRFDPVFIANFLDYCLSKNIKLDVLSWHEFKTGDEISKVADDVLLARTQFVNNPKYASLQIKSIQINEIIHTEDQFSPGSILAYFSYLEKGGADGACKGCWNESNGKSNCFTNTLDGLLDPATLQPRAAWWAYRYYNLSLKNRFQSQSNNNHIVCLANNSTPNKIQILLGYYGSQDKNPNNISVYVDLTKLDKLASFASKSTVNIKVSTIPDSGESVLTAPAKTLTIVGHILNGHLGIAIPQIYLKSACVVEVI